MQHCSEAVAQSDKIQLFNKVSLKLSELIFWVKKLNLDLKFMNS